MHSRAPVRLVAMVVTSVLVVLVGCSGGSSGGDVAARTTTTAGAATTSTAGATTTTVVAATPSSGCGTAPDPGPTDDPSGDVTQTLTSGAKERTYRLAVPAKYDPAEAVPLVFNFHGLGSNAVQQTVYSAIPKVGHDRGLLVVTPDAIGGVWALSGPTGTVPADIQYIKDLLASVEGRYCVDTNRVFAAGMSLGALMSAATACALPGTIAAIGLVAVEFKPNDCQRVPVVVFHGTKDTTVPYDAGGSVNAGQFTGTKVKGTLNSLKDWAALDGCATEPKVEALGTDVEHRTYPGCKGGTEVELYSVVGGGHTWPGSAIKIGPTTQTIDATDLILEFFAAHPKPAPPR